MDPIGFGEGFEFVAKSTQAERIAIEMGLEHLIGLSNDSTCASPVPENSSVAARTLTHNFVHAAWSSISSTSLAEHDVKIVVAG